MPAVARLTSDIDGDLIDDVRESTYDWDGDGIPNTGDLDSDDDGVSDIDEGLIDADGDGISKCRNKHVSATRVTISSDAALRRVGALC